MAAAPVKLGPGTLKIGATGSEIDVSCQINNAVISADKDEGDSITKLCGDVVPGAVTYLVLDPLDFGGDEAGTYMTSDFEFSLVGSPSYTFPPGGATADDETVAA
jgi:hypothetical protein